MRRVAALLACAGLTAALPAQVRRTTSLDGLWQVRAAGPDGAPGTGPWRDAWVPAAFETVLGAAFDGAVEYRKRFRLPGRKAGDPVFVRFGAVMTEARVRWNGVEVGRHMGGWTPFRCRLPEAALRDGLQELAVWVDEKVGHDTQGFLPAIQPHFGGIWQSVDLQCYAGPGFDPDRVELRGFFDAGRARLRVRFGALPGGVVSVAVRDPGAHVARGEWRLPQPRPGAQDEVREVVLPDGVRPWAPAAPVIYDAELAYRPAPDGPVADRIERRVAFVGVAARGRSILLNGRPLQLRGILDWGFSPPRYAPNPPASVWRDEMRWARSCGFNLIKACLWIPPPSFFDVALEEGMVVWQEYPAWHPDFSTKHRAALLREYGEFFRLDRSRAPIIARSLTCETGRAAADATVVEALYDRCKRVTGAALVEDDSSWISWSRFHDFWDDHPYGNCGPWLSRLRGFDAYIREHGAQPFLLGEAMAADTWVDLDAVRSLLAGRDPWWKPYALGSMAAFERWVAGRLGPGAVRALGPDSKAYALRARKYQFESFRRVLPDAGYVSSVLRDFMQARMGFFDDAGRPKWTARDFAWHGDRMLVLDDPRAIRSIPVAALATFRPAVRLAGDPQGLGRPVLRTRARIETFDGSAWILRQSRSAAARVAIEPAGPLLSKPLALPVPEGPAPRLGGVARCRLHVELTGVAANDWTFWAMDPGGGAAPPPAGVRVAAGVTPELLGWVEQGGRLLLEAGGRGGLASRSLWFLEGAPFAPLDHPLLETLPRDLLLALQPFDLDGPLYRWTSLARGFDPVLGFWDTHDERESVQKLAFLLEARVGKGRVLACSLNLDTGPEPAFAGAAPAGPNPARAWVRRRLLAHLGGGPAPGRLPAAQVARWRAALAANRVELGGVWLLAPDPKDAGRAAGWADPGFDDSSWIRSRTGVHWEAAGLPHYDGIAWYRKRFDPPPGWRPGRPLYAVFDGVDDSYVLWVNGRRVAAFGDPATHETVWLTRTYADIGPFLKEGSDLIALRVVDHQGAGGLHRRVWLASTEPGIEDLVNR